MMKAVRKGMDRQDVHEIIRELSMEEVKSIKLYGNENHLIDRILKDGRLGITCDEMNDILNPSKYIGFSIEQTEEYLKKVIFVIEKNRKYLNIPKEEVTV